MGLKLEWDTETLEDGRIQSQADVGGYVACVQSFGQSVCATYWAASVCKAGRLPVEESRSAWSDHNADSLAAAQEAAEATAARLLAEDAGVRALVSLIGDALTDAPADEPMRGLVDFIAVHVERDALRAKVAELEASLRWIPVAEGLPDEDTQVQLAMPDRGISLGHLSRTVISGVDVWSLPRVRRVDIDDATHWRPLGGGPVAASSADSANLAATAEEGKS